MLKYEANKVLVDTPEAVFGTSPDNSAEVLSNLDTTGSLNGGNASLNRCLVSITLGSLSCDSEDYCSEPESTVPSCPKKLSKRTRLPYVMRQSQFGRRRGREPEALTKTEARVSLAEYTSLKASGTHPSI